MKNNKNFYYNKELSELEIYQQLIQYWSIMFDGKKDVYILDNMNFNISIFPELITMPELVSLHEIEPGYMSPDGHTEMNLLIKDLEYARLTKDKQVNEQDILSLVNAAGIGCGNGCTNVINAIINSIIKFNQQTEETSNKDEIIIIFPNYTVYAAQLSNLSHKIKVKPVYTDRSSNFLPTYEDIKDNITDNTSMLIITYPNNPAQSTYSKENSEELKKIINLCKKNKTFLILDNIYQDLIFSDDPFTEIFNLTNSLDYIIKVYGSSKDTPFYSGFRTGYWFGDPRIMEIYKYYISSTENSLNSYSMALFAYNLYFKLKKITNTFPQISDMKYFSNGVFGWSREVSPEKLLNSIKENQMYEKYLKRIDTAVSIQKKANEEVKAFVEKSSVFDDFVNESIGNVFFIKVNDAYFSGTYDELFKYLYYDVGCGVLPGSVFGIRRKEHGIWFRITLIHDTIENIIVGLERIEHALLLSHKN